MIYRPAGMWGSAHAYGAPEAGDFRAQTSSDHRAPRDAAVSLT